MSAATRNSGDMRDTALGDIEAVAMTACGPTDGPLLKKGFQYGSEGYQSNDPGSKPA